MALVVKEHTSVFEITKNFTDVVTLYVWYLHFKHFQDFLS